MQIRLNMNTQLLFHFYWTPTCTFVNMCVMGGQGLNCITDSRLPDSYGPPVAHRPPLYIHFTRNTEEPVNLIFPPKDLPLPTQWTSHSFQLHQIVLPPLPSLTPNINRKKRFPL